MLRLYRPGFMSVLVPKGSIFSVKKYYLCEKSSPFNEKSFFSYFFSRLFWPKKSRTSQKVSILCKGPFRILKLAPFSDLAG